MSLAQVTRQSGRQLELIAGRIYLPAVEAGSVYGLELDLDGDTPLTIGERVQIEVAESWSVEATVVRASALAGRAHAALVVGRGGLQAQVRSEQFSQCSAADVARRICRDSGEELDDGAALATIFPSFTLWSAKAKTAFTRLSEAIGMPWRMTIAGRVTYGPVMFTEQDVDGDLVSDDGSQRIYAVERPTLLPGLIVDGERFGDVDHEIRTDAVRTRIRRWRGA